jgi:hypothetical protein
MMHDDFSALNILSDRNPLLDSSLHLENAPDLLANNHSLNSSLHSLALNSIPLTVDMRTNPPVVSDSLAINQKYDRLYGDILSNINRLTGFTRSKLSCALPNSL